MVLCLGAGWSSEAETREAGRRKAEVARTAGARAELEREARRWRDAALAGEAADTPAVEEWVARLRTATGYSGGPASVAVGERDVGLTDGVEEARGPRVMFAMQRALTSFGGDEGWMLREDVGEDGWAVDWRGRADAAVEGLMVEKDPPPPKTLRRVRRENFGPSREFYVFRPASGNQPSMVVRPLFASPISRLHRRAPAALGLHDRARRRAFPSRAPTSPAARTRRRPQRATRRPASTSATPLTWPRSSPHAGARRRPRRAARPLGGCAHPRGPRAVLRLPAQVSHVTRICVFAPTPAVPPAPGFSSSHPHPGFLRRAVEFWGGGAPVCRL